MSDFKAIDFETDEIGFFDKTKSKKLMAKDHPRHAKIIFGSVSDGVQSKIEADFSSYKSLLKDSAFHNISFDGLVGIENHLWTLQELRANRPNCTFIMAKLLKNDAPAGLKPLAKYVLGIEIPENYSQIDKNNREAFYAYAKNDALYTAKLYFHFEKELQNAGQWFLYRDVELPFAFINMECEINGFAVECEKISDTIKVLRRRIKEVEFEIDPSVNFSSHQQVKRFVFGELNQPLTYQKGRISSSKKSLEQIQHPKVQKIVSRQESMGTVRQLETLTRFIDPISASIHPHVKTLGADTGRCTSSNPNLQNINKDSNLRELFIARPGRKLIVLDFGQIEPRVLAHFLNPSPFSQLFSDAEDFYKRLGREVFTGVGSDVPARAIAKQIVLATFYGMGARTLAESLKIPVATAHEHLGRFHAAYPEISLFRDEQIKRALQNGFAEGLLNRRRYISDLNSSDDRKRFSAERKVLNAIIQGSAATIFKYKLVRLRERLPTKVRFLLHVHDEVILEAPEESANEILKVSKQLLEEPLQWFSIPLVADGGVGSNWSQAKNA